MESMKLYRRLVDRVEAFTALVRRRYSSFIKCRKGCCTCCTPSFGVFPVEAWAVKEGFGCLPPKAREALLRAAKDTSREDCPALEQSACLLYPLRPVLCRTHGYPLLVLGEAGEPTVRFCELNFRPQEFSPGVISGDCVLDLEQLNRALAAVNISFLKEQERPGVGGFPQRVPILHFLVNS